MSHLTLTPEQLAAYEARQLTARTVSPQSDKSAKLLRDSEEARIRNAERLASMPRLGRPEERKSTPEPIPEPVRNKFRNVPTVVDGIKFPSKREARRYGELKLLEKAGQITELTLQPRFPCAIGTELICTYIADFSFLMAGKLVVEDTKSDPTMTPVYRIKKKLVRALYGVEIQEV